MSATNVGDVAGNENGSPHVQQAVAKEDPAAPGGKPAGQSEGQDAIARGNTKQWGARSIDLFKKVDQIGEGQYGQVHFIPASFWLPLVTG